MHDPSDHEHDEQTFDGFSLDEIKKNFKSLSAELEGGGENILDIVGKEDVSPEEYGEQEESDDPYRGYIPTIKDYLQRASTVEECEEVISYCLSQGEISEDEAKVLRNRLERGGPRAFGTRRPGYYDQNRI